VPASILVLVPTIDAGVAGVYVVPAAASSGVPGLW